VTLLHRVASIVRWLLRRDRAERQLDEEMRTFVDLCAADKMRNGVPAAEARRLAVLELGGIEQTKERVRTSRHGALVDEVGRDVRYAFRTFARNPGFVVVVVLTLALGIGANTAIFSLIDALMLRWLPVRHPQELVQLRMRLPEDTGPGGDTFSYAIVRALADQHEIFESLAGFSGYGFNAGSGDSIGKVPGALVTGGYYETLGLNAAAGRLLNRSDDDPGAPLAAVISDGYWARQFLRSPAAIGQTLVLGGAPATIVGVSPRGFTGANVGATADITTTIAAFASVNRQVAEISGPGNYWLRVLARPAPEVSTAEAESRLQTVWSRVWDDVVAAHWPPSRRLAFATARFSLSPGGTGWTRMREMYRRPLIVLMSVVGLVLLIACANVASLMLARASARQREIAVRLAFGASRGRILRQLLIESTLLSLIGAAFAILLAWVSGRVLLDTMFPGALRVALDLTPNWHIFGFTVAVAVTTGMLFGLAPAFQAIATGPSPALNDDARTGSSRSRWLASLIVTQVALSLLLLVGAGLFLGTLRNLQRLDPGFNPEGVLIVDLEGRRTAVPQELLDEIQRVPGVVSVSLSTHTPLSGSVWSDPAVPRGQPIPERDTAFFIGAGPRFLEIMQTPLVAGRDFTERDSADAQPVAVVNQAYARRFFPNQQPIGQYLSAVVRGDRRDLEIVGVAKDTSAAGLRRAAPATVYVSYRQLTGSFPTTLVIRATASLTETASAIRRAIQPRLPDTPIEVLPLSAQVDAAMVQERLMAALASAFGALALVLACVGLYGLLAYNVVRRTKEMGIRVALGAQRTQVVAMVLGSAMRLVVMGVLLGLPAAWAASHAVRSMLFGLRPADPATIAGAIFLLAIASVIAAYVPAWRASRIEPLTALRHE
jgi:putative ABC transport system permease protein